MFGVHEPTPGTIAVQRQFGICSHPLVDNLLFPAGPLTPASSFTVFLCCLGHTCGLGSRLFWVYTMVLVFL